MTDQSRRGFPRRRLPRLLLAAGLVALTLVPTPAGAVVSTTPEPFWGVAGLPGAVNDATDARVYAVLEANGRIYVGGEFTLAVAPDGTTVERRNLIALDAATGVLDPTFTPDPANAVRALEATPDGSRLYVAGPFSRINGENHGRLAALDPTTGATIPGWRVDANAPVWSLELSPDGILYAGGMFTTLTDADRTHSRDHLGAIDVHPDRAPAGRVVEGWRADTVGYTETVPVLDGDGNPIYDIDPVTGERVLRTETVRAPGFVRALQLARDGRRLLVGGEFVSIGGEGQRNLASLDAVTADVDRRFDDSSRRVFDIDVDAERIYVALGGGGGEGRALHPVTGRELWSVNGNGDFQAVAVIRDLVYFGGHFGTDDGNPFEGEPRDKLAAVEADTGDVHPFAPDFNSALGVWTLHARCLNLHVGGDFTRVTGVERPHYVRLTGDPEPPGPPTGVGATASGGQATVSWVAPACDGQRPVTGYRITPYRDGVAQPPVIFAAPVTSGTVTGLDNGVPYTFTVAALNELGWGGDSEASEEVTPLALPSMAEAPAATAGDGQIHLSWPAPVDDGGAAVSAYTVTPYRDGVAQGPRTVPAPERSLTLTGLTNGVPYAFTVAATNVVGTGPPSPRSPALAPRTTPGSPFNVAASPGSGRAVVRWSPPADDGGAAITAYVVVPHRDGEAGTPSTFPGTVTAGTVTGLEDDAVYTFTVTAWNVAGPGPPSAPSSAVVPQSGYWMLDRSGKVHPFGGAGAHGDPAGQLSAGAVDLEATPTGDGYWVLTDAGAVYGYGDAGYQGGVPAGALAAGERATGLSATPSGAGYWIFTSRGRAFARGDATHFGDLAGVTLNGPVLDSVATPSGRGYYMVAADGGIFAFGDAAFAGSMGGLRLNAPVVSMAPDPDGDGYWLVASDGGIFAFRAPFSGSMGGVRLNRPVTGMVAGGSGYLLVATDGGIFNFSDRPFYGSLGADPPADPVTAVATR